MVAKRGSLLAYFRDIEHVAKPSIYADINQSKYNTGAMQKFKHDHSDPKDINQIKHCFKLKDIALQSV